MNAAMKHCSYCEWLETPAEISKESIISAKEPLQSSNLAPSVPSTSSNEEAGHSLKLALIALTTAAPTLPVTKPASEQSAPPQELLESYDLAPAEPSTPIIVARKALSYSNRYPEAITVTDQTLRPEAVNPDLSQYCVGGGRKRLGFFRCPELLMWSLMPAAAALAIDALLGMAFGREPVITNTDWFFVYIVLMIAYVSLGLALSGLVYRFSMLGLAAVSLFMIGVRLTIVPYVQPQLVMGAANTESALAIAAFNGLFAWVFVSLASGAGILALRLTESELQFPEARTARNPVKAIFHGLAEMGLGVLGFCGWAFIHKTGTASADTFVALLFMVIVADGVRRAFAAAKVYSGIHARYCHAARASQSF